MRKTVGATRSQEPTGAITHATYSCDSQSIYASFGDGSVGVLSATTLRLRCRINPTAYLPSNITSNNSRVYPLVVVAHPSERNQFVLGLSDGGVHVLEPLQFEEKWGTLPPSDNDAGLSITTGQELEEKLEQSTVMASSITSPHQPIIFASTSSINKDGNWAKALEALETMGRSGIEVSVSTWNSIMASCVRYGDEVLAFETLRRMSVLGLALKPNSATFNTSVFVTDRHC
ncbi:Topless-like [Thalictrum thalictroides]|uniref:Topless-like n=1 Tax=Thalictrum thalictroides TaxID=46969 RepID=A0A7J6WN14_THATH|nr:Topless-like [Thalictrum thalictroides]